MENRKHKSSSVSIGMGGSLIVIIFVSLCLTIFSVLSFTTAYSDLKLSKKTAEMNFDYYNIHGNAEEKLAEIYDALISDKNLENISDVVLLLDQVNNISIVDQTNDSARIYYESIGEKNQKICVTLVINFDKNAQQLNYDIEKWKLSSIELPDYKEENYNLWEGFE